MGICLFNLSWRQSECFDGLEFLFIIRYQIFKRVISPSIDLINGHTDGVLVTDLDSLDRVVFFPGIFIESYVVLYPRVARIGEGEVCQDLKVEEIVEHTYLILFYFVILVEYALDTSLLGLEALGNISE